MLNEMRAFMSLARGDLLIPAGGMGREFDKSKKD
jgi:hypothetical protein